MERFVWICLAGAAGTGTRYLMASWAAQRFGTDFPYGTLIVNLTGCFLIALVIEAASMLAWPPTLRAALSIGFLGGFTTYSAFNYESSRMLADGAPGLAAINVAATLFGCALAGWFGLVAARQLFGAGD
jgi:CrcB protein